MSDMKGYRRNYRRQLSSRSSESSSQSDYEDISESFSSESGVDESEYSSPYDARYTKPGGRDDFPPSEDKICTPSLPKPPPIQFRHQRLSQLKSRSIHTRIYRRTHYNDGNISKQSSYIYSQYASSDESGVSFSSDNSSDKSVSSTLTHIDSTQKRWRDYFSSCPKQMLNIFERLWSSDYVFVYMAISIFSLFGLIIMVLAMRKQGQIHDSDYGMNETVVDSLIPSIAPLLKVSLAPSLVKDTKPSSTPTMIMTSIPSTSPTEMLSYKQSKSPSLDTSSRPSQKPSPIPTISPSITTKPSQQPSTTTIPTAIPSISFEPSLSSNPSSEPTEKMCTCAPLTYQFKIDLKKGCPLNISDNRGIKGTIDCNYESQRNHTHFSPVVVTEVSITELNSNLVGIQTFRKNATMLDGFTITFESVTTSGQITGGLKGNFKAINLDGEFTLNFLLLFSNTCEILPFNVDDSIGFLVFVSCHRFFYLHIHKRELISVLYLCPLFLML